KHLVGELGVGAGGGALELRAGLIARGGVDELRPAYPLTDDAPLERRRPQGVRFAAVGLVDVPSPWGRADQLAAGVEAAVPIDTSERGISGAATAAMTPAAIALHSLAASHLVVRADQ